MRKQTTCVQTWASYCGVTLATLGCLSCSSDDGKTDGAAGAGGQAITAGIGDGTGSVGGATASGGAAAAQAGAGAAVAGASGVVPAMTNGGAATVPAGGATAAVAGGAAVGPIAGGAAVAQPSDGGAGTTDIPVASGGATANAGTTAMAGAAAGGAATSNGGASAGATANGGTTAMAGAAAGGAANPDMPDMDVEGVVTFTPPGAAFEGSLDITLASVTAGEIHYTVDGTVPTSASPVYSAAVTVTATTQIRAIVVADTLTVAEGSSVYLGRSGEITSNIPIVVIDNYQGGPVIEESGGFNAAGERPFVDATFMSFGVEGGVASLANTPDVATRAAFHVRGQSSASFPKTPYRLELRDNDEDDKKFELLGMPSQSDWVLRGPYADKSLIRDAFFYSLGTEMGMQAPRFVHAEFYINTDNATVDQDDYMGVYVIGETIKNSKARLDLAQLREEDTTLPDITGGYIFKFEWRAGEEPMIACNASTSCWTDLEVYDPLPINVEQKDWLSTYVHEFHETLYGDAWQDDGAGYAAMIEPGSFVDQLIINEIGRELDSYVRSAYYHKDRGDLLTAGPLWDYNLSFGIGGFFQNSDIEGWQYLENGVNRTPVGNSWYVRLMDDPAFVDRVKARWQALRSGLISDSALEDRVTALATPIAEAAARNFERWDILGQTSIEPGFNTDATDTWEEQVELLRVWMRERVTWLDSQWGS